MAHYHEVKETKAAPAAPQRVSLADGVRRLAYASLGLLSVMSDEVETFYEKCVTRGEQRANEARASTRERQVARRPRRTTARAGQPVAAVLRSIGNGDQVRHGCPQRAGRCPVTCNRCAGGAKTVALSEKVAASKIACTERCA